MELLEVPSAEGEDKEECSRYVVTSKSRSFTLMKQWSHRNASVSFLMGLEKLKFDNNVNVTKQYCFMVTREARVLRGDSHASLVLSNFPRASITRRTNCNNEIIVNYNSVTWSELILMCKIQSFWVQGLNLKQNKTTNTNMGTSHTWKTFSGSRSK